MATVTSKYGPRNLNGRTFHHGVDLAAPIGSPLYTNKELTVTQATQQTGYGNVVYAVDNAGTEYRFAHLDGFATGVKPGTRLSSGSQIGYTGITGTESDGAQTSTGAHLHYEVRRGGQSVDPLTTIDPSTGKPYINNASFAKDGSSLRNSTPTKDPAYTPKGTAAATPKAADGSTNKAPSTRSITPPKTGEPPVSNKPQSIKIPRINPLLKLGD